jgi:hypothetical protein
MSRAAGRQQDCDDPDQAQHRGVSLTRKIKGTRRKRADRAPLSLLPDASRDLSSERAGPSSKAQVRVERTLKC